MRAPRTLALLVVLCLALQSVTAAFAQYPPPADILTCTYSNGVAVIHVADVTGVPKSGVNVTYINAQGVSITALTDGSGNATLPAGPTGTATAYYGALTAQCQIPDPGTNLTCNYANGTVVISARDNFGNPRAFIPVTFTDASGAVYAGTTDASGNAYFNVFVAGNGTARYNVFATPCSVPSQRSALTCNYTNGNAYITVRDEFGNPRPYVTITYTTAAGIVVTLTTDGAGNVTTGAGPYGTGVARYLGLTANCQVPPPNIVLLCTYTNGSAVITVKDELGAPKASFTVTYTDAGGNTVTVVTDGSGNATVPGGPPGTATARYQTLTAYCQVPPPPVVVVPLSLTCAYVNGNVVITVIDSSGKGKGGVQVSYLNVAGAIAVATTDANGNAVVAAGPAGRSTSRYADLSAPCTVPPTQAVAQATPPPVIEGIAPPNTGEGGPADGGTSPWVLAVIALTGVAVVSGGVAAVGLKRR
jgi:hypothetical protein